MAYQDPNSAQARGQYWADNNLLSALGSGVKAGTPEGRVMAQSAADNIVYSFAEPGIVFLAQDARVVLTALREGHSLARARAAVEISQELDRLTPCMKTCIAAKSTVQANKIAGDAFRDEIAYGLKMEGRDVATEVYKRTPFGKRYIDIEVSLEGKVLGGVETKVGGSRYTPLQRVKDTWLRLVEDYPVNVVRDR